MALGIHICGRFSFTLAKFWNPQKCLMLSLNSPLEKHIFFCNTAINFLTDSAKLNVQHLRIADSPRTNYFIMDLWFYLCRCFLGTVSALCFCEGFQTLCFSCPLQTLPLLPHREYRSINTTWWGQHFTSIISRNSVLQEKTFADLRMQIPNRTIFVQIHEKNTTIMTSWRLLSDVRPSRRARQPELCVFYCVVT